MPTHTPSERAKRAGPAPSGRSAGQPAGQPDSQGDLGSFILKAPEDLWLQIKSALQVETRQQAAELVASNPDAQRIVSQILTGDGAQSLSPRQPQQALAASSRPSSLAGSRRTGSGAGRVEF